MQTVRTGLYRLRNPWVHKLLDTDLMYEGGSDRVEVDHCPMCGRVLGMLGHQEPLLFDLEQWGPHFADLVSSGNELYLSERLLTALNQEQIIGIEGAMPIQIRRYVRRRRTAPRSYPQYFMLRVQFDGSRLNDTLSRVIPRGDVTCSLCRGTSPRKLWRMVIDRPVGAVNDVFQLLNWNVTVVTQKFVDVCQRPEFTVPEMLHAPCVRDSDALRFAWERLQRIRLVTNMDEQSRHEER